MLDEAILRPGRFDRLIEVPKPDETARERIFKIHTRGMNLDDDIDFRALARRTPDASGADINAICTEAGMVAIRDDRTTVQTRDFHRAIDKLELTEEDEGVSRTFA
jgi:proteasome regulatory subunit